MAKPIDEAVARRDLKEIVDQLEKAKHMPVADYILFMNRLLIEFLHVHGQLTPAQRKRFARHLPKEH